MNVDPHVRLVLLVTEDDNPCIEAIQGMFPHSNHRNYSNLVAATGSTNVWPTLKSLYIMTLLSFGIYLLHICYYM